MNIFLKEPFPSCAGIELPKDFGLAVKDGVDFKIAADKLVLEAMEKGPGTWEHDTWLPIIKEATYRMIIHGLMIQLMEAKKSFYKRWFNKIRKLVR